MRNFLKKYSSSSLKCVSKYHLGNLTILKAETFRYSQIMKRGIIVFQRNAELGKVKTRLAASIGDHEALEIYKVLINFTHQQIQEIDVIKLVYFSDFLEVDFKRIDKEDQLFLQSEGNLGNKMSKAFQTQFENGFDRLLIIGTDCPELTPEIIEKAFDELEQSEVVIGPAKDGGYYLLGMKRFNPGLFKNIKWSSAEVLNSTENFLRSKEIKYSLLPLLSDVDYLEDWELIKDKIGPTKKEN